MRYLDDENYESAIKSFQRSVDLDKKFAEGYAGLGLAYGLTGGTTTSLSGNGKYILLFYSDY